MSVDPSSPAARAGLRARDVITDAAKKPVRSAKDLIDRAGDRDRLLLRVHRQGGSIFIVLEK